MNQNRRQAEGKVRKAKRIFMFNHRIVSVGFRCEPRSPDLNNKKEGRKKERDGRMDRRREGKRDRGTGRGGGWT